ncbi:hypothetical protein FHU33_3412 [Blastococcus colisei]|uniref:CopC domain-containing protein n=1 Tax=Blastococcus colisei TaxID=1564162 RepID=A0A543PIR1_9ACTN|nr:copper resistance protein CopC [Blastococcus colisei]TQN43937.1 hypothetical protein FHU33_3412 [Blastococcus colisei]
MADHVPTHRRTALSRFAIRMAAGVMTTLALLLGFGATSASAHDALVAITPSADATLDVPPAQVTLEFSGRPQALGTQALVSGSDGGQVSVGAAELRDTSVVQPLSDDLPSGTYTVEWRVTSSDGHALSGTSTFTIAETSSAAADPSAATVPPAATTPSDPGPAAPAAGSANAAAPASETDGLSSPVAWTAAGTVLAAAGVLIVRRRRARP